MYPDARNRIKCHRVNTVTTLLLMLQLQLTDVPRFFTLRKDSDILISQIGRNEIYFGIIYLRSYQDSMCAPNSILLAIDLL